MGNTQSYQQINYKDMQNWKREYQSGWEPKL